MLRLLFLGGTEDARKLADILQSEFSKRVYLTYSLAGITENPALPKNIAKMNLHQGGFGGMDGLASYLKNFDALLDATHPFSRNICKNAQQACRIAALPYLRYLRPAWQQNPNSTPPLIWQEVTDFNQSLEHLIRLGSRQILLAIGMRGAQYFTADNSKRHYFLRLIDKPRISALSETLPENFHLITARPPFDEAQELDFFQKNSIDTLICRNSGGSSGLKKLRAAGRIGVNIIMQQHPQQFAHNNSNDGINIKTDNSACILWVRALTQD